MARVNFTRMELMRLQRRLELARRGHRLLKDKEEQLSSYFYRLVEQARGARSRLEADFLEAVDCFQSARAPWTGDRLAQFFDPPSSPARVEYRETGVLNIMLPRFECRDRGEPPEPLYGVPPADITETVDRYRALLEPLLRLAEIEKAIVLFAREIESTRRRVNSLEHILIPDLEQTTRAIRMRLEEMERESFVRLRHIKRLHS